MGDSSYERYRRMDIDETGLVPFQKLLLRCWYQAHMLGSPQVAYPENGVSAWTWVKMVTVHWQYSLGDVNMRRVSRQTSRWRPFGPDTRLRGGCPGLLEWMVSSVLEASQHQEPRGATGNARGELLAGSSVATGGLDIHQDHPREPGPELHETAGINNGCDR